MDFHYNYSFYHMEKYILIVYNVTTKNMKLFSLIRLYKLC
jgi:hypothetical protein